MKPKRERKVYYAHYFNDAERHAVIRIGGSLWNSLDFVLGNQSGSIMNRKKSQLQKKVMDWAELRRINFLQDR